MAFCISREQLVDLRLLHRFIVIAEQGSVSEASRQLRVSQPMLSQQLRQLERQVGSALFERGSRGMELTEAGRALLGPARLALRAADAAIDAARQAAAAVVGELRVGLLHGGVAELTTPIIRTFRASYPKVELSVTPVLVTELESGLLERQVDVALQYLPIGSPQLHADPLFDEPRVLLMSEHHRFSGILGVTSAEFVASPTVQTLHQAPAHWSSFWSFAELRDGAPLDCRREFDDVHAAMMFVSVSDDVSIPVPVSISRFVAFSGLRSVPLTDASACTAAVVYRADDHRPSVEAFRRVAIDTASRLRFLVAQATAPGAGHGSVGGGR
ncbi:LysR family transcriptional regulator [Dactylosporangium sp. NPDC049525]|uniref:LysR family transcriptional regulator n=1 Tax=Dactylosporangium sp. NPDC049525 TaxID=3154730 RepID=UPI00344A7007